MDYVALKAELLGDPNGYGYAPFVASGSDADLAVMLNTVRGGISIDRDIVQSHEIVSCVVGSEWSALTDTQRQNIQFVTGAGMVNVKSPNVRTVFTTAFGPATTTRANIVAILTRAGSRAEQLLGQSVSANDIAVALRET